MQIDANGIVAVLGAASAFIIGVGTFALKVLSELRQMKTQQSDMHTEITKTHDLVNGLAERKDDAVKAAAKAEGKIEGKAESEQVVAAAIDLTKTAILKTADPPPPK